MQVTKEQLKQFLSNYQRQIDMGHWGNSKEPRSLVSGKDDPEFCGTTFCIAGAICLVAGGKLVYDNDGDAYQVLLPGTEDSRSIPLSAMHLIGLLPDLPTPKASYFLCDEQPQLFHLELWPIQLRENYIFGERFDAVRNAIDELWPVKEEAQ